MNIKNYFSSSKIENWLFNLQELELMVLQIPQLSRIWLILTWERERRFVN